MSDHNSTLFIQVESLDLLELDLDCKIPVWQKMPNSSLLLSPSEIPDFYSPDLVDLREDLPSE